MPTASPSPSPFLSDFRILKPAWSGTHEESIAWLSRAHAKAEATVRKGQDFDEEAFRTMMERHIRRFGCGPESLARRHHDLADYLHTDWERMRIFTLNRHPSGAGMEERNRAFTEIAEAKAEAFYPVGEDPPDDFIHVSCTGYAAPSALQKLVVRRGWQDRTGVTHAYHMGCYASMPAVRMAAGYLALRAPLPARVDIVHAEACSLHLDPSRHNPEQLVVQSLFADGHIRYSLRSDRGPGPALAFIACREVLVPGTEDSIGWNPGDHGMRMTLSRDVPERIAGALKPLLRTLFTAAGVDSAEALSRGLFAVHPGGPRIIDQVATLLELAPIQVEASRAVLREHGNMSSATLPHVWERLAGDSAVAPGTLITSLAFGPGLTIYGAVLRKA